MQKVAGVIFVIVAAVVGLVASMTTLVISDGWTYFLFAVCGLAAIGGIVLMFWPTKSSAQNAKLDGTSVTSHNQSGGITAHTVDLGGEDVRKQ